MLVHNCRQQEMGLSDQPTQVFHPSLVPKTGGLLGSAASGAHYSGAKLHHRRTDMHRASGSGDPIELTENHQRVLDDLKELYCCRPSSEIFRRTFREDAEFEDPLTYCKGVNEIASQWFAVTKVVSKSGTLSHRVLASTQHPNRIIYAQTQEYVLRLFGIKRTIKSIILVDLDEEGRIIRLEDQWNGEEPSSAWGLGMLRRLNGRATPWIVRPPKDLRKSD